MDNAQEILNRVFTLPVESALDTLDFALAMGISLVFGLILHQLYNLYFQDNEPQDGSLARSLVLLAPSLTATFLMIQSSLALSLGLLGSLSFVRFRTPVKRAEDVSFIIVVVAVAIACASGVYVLAIALVCLLFLFTYARNLWGAHMGKKERSAIITFNTRRKASTAEIQGLFDTVNVKSDFISSRSYDGITSYVFNAPRVSKDAHDAIASQLAQYDTEAHINIFYPNDRLGA
jgi:hypothetical protein